MPEFLDVVRSQRGTVYYKPDPIPDEVLDQVLEAATRAPSGSNRQPWRFIVLRDREVKRRMGELYLEAQRRMTGSERRPAKPGETGPPTSACAMEDVPALVMFCVERWKMRGSESYRGASIYPSGAEPDARRSSVVRARHTSHDGVAALLRGCGSRYWACRTTGR